MIYMLMQSGISPTGEELSREHLEYQVFPSLQRRAQSVGIYGELGRPPAPNQHNPFSDHSAAAQRWFVVSMDRACLVIRQVWLENLPNGELAVYGEVTPLNTHAGSVYAANINYCQVQPRVCQDCSEQGCYVRDVVTFDAVPVAA